jgi:oligoribonuclease (3'-5' exoribonuclease)
MPDVQATETPRVSELEHVIPFDLETSGLDEQEDQILEVHMRMGAIRSGGYTDYGGPEGLTIVLPISSDVRLWHPAVVEMHTKNGLIVEAHKVLAGLTEHIRHDCADAPLEASAMTEIACDEALDDADDALCAYLATHWVVGKDTKPPKWTLLGNSVHFDLRFVRRLFPNFAAQLSHRVIDVSAIRMFTEALGLPYQKDEPAHRAAADVAYSIKSFERYQAWCQDRYMSLVREMARGGT